MTSLNGRLLGIFPFVILIITKVVNASFCWSANTGLSVGSSPYENITHEFVLITLTVPSTSCSSFLNGLCDLSFIYEIVYIFLKF